MLCAIDRFPFDTLDAQRDHARELNRILRENEVRKLAKRIQDQTTRVIRRAVSV